MRVHRDLARRRAHAKIDRRLLLGIHHRPRNCHHHFRVAKNVSVSWEYLRRGRTLMPIMSRNGDRRWAVSRRGGVASLEYKVRKNPDQPRNQGLNQQKDSQGRRVLTASACGARSVLNHPYRRSRNPPSTQLGNIGRLMAGQQPAILSRRNTQRKDGHNTFRVSP